MRYLSCFLLLGAISATAQQTAPVDPDLIYRRAEARQQRLKPKRDTARFFHS